MGLSSNNKGGSDGERVFLQVTGKTVKYDQGNLVQFELQISEFKDFSPVQSLRIFSHFIPEKLAQQQLF